MRVRSVNHVSLPVRDLDRSLAVYRDFLGLAQVPRPDFPMAGAWLGVGNAQVHLIVTPEGLAVDQPAPSLSPLASHLALTVDDYAEALGCVRERELEVIETTPEIGQLWVRDPDGHVSELITAPARR